MLKKNSMAKKSHLKELANSGRSRGGHWFGANPEHHFLWVAGRLQRSLHGAGKVFVGASPRVYNVGKNYSVEVSTRSSGRAFFKELICCSETLEFEPK